MKKTFLATAFFVAVSASAQKASDYQYILIPEKFTKFKDDNFDLDKTLEKSLIQKKYLVIDGSEKQQSSVLYNNPCDVLTADIIDNSSLLSNRIILELRDCKNNIILSEKASSKIKSLKEGFQDALKKALIRLPVSNPKPLALNQSQGAVTNENNPVKAAQSKVQNYSNGKKILQRVNISGNVFILADSADSAPFATFQATSKQDVFLVKLKNGETTVGYFENGNIIIDIPSENGNFVKEVFSFQR